MLYSASLVGLELLKVIPYLSIMTIIMYWNFSFCAYAVDNKIRGIPPPEGFHHLGTLHDKNTLCLEGLNANFQKTYTEKLRTPAILG